MTFWCSESHKAACFSVCSVNPALVTEMETSIHWANKQSRQANLLNTEVLSSFNKQQQHQGTDERDFMYSKSEETAMEEKQKWKEMWPDTGMQQRLLSERSKLK